MTENDYTFKKHSISKFLAEAPLFTPFKAVENYIRQCHTYTNPFEIKCSTFSFRCENEDEIRTFELHLTKANSKHFGSMRGEQIAAELFALDGRLDFEHHFVGECKSRKEYHVDLLLHVYTDKPIPQDQSNTIRFDLETIRSTLQMNTSPTVSIFTSRK